MSKNTTTADELLQMAAELEQLEKARMLESVYGDPRHPEHPYEWQWEFHDAGATKPHRALLAANQVGKTRTGAAEVAAHCTGLYPDRWKGKVFEKPVRVLAAGPTNQVVRDVQQLSLFGPMREGEKVPSGEGWIPAETITRYGFRQCGIPDVLDSVKIRHTSGGFSEIMLKSYEQGATKFQGIKADIIWPDEEPEDPRIFSEMLARLTTTKGILIFTRTPLFGLTEMIRHFTDGGDHVYHQTATWDDAPHIDADQKQILIDSFPPHERATRTKGIPMMGSGGVYPIPDEMISVPPMQIPGHWRRICGIDFGIDHPAAACWIAHDTDADIVYVYDCYRMAGEVAAYHASAIKSRGLWIPVAWPHDGMIRDRGGGETLADQYLAEGVNMLAYSARYDDDKAGGQAREPATVEILGRMRTGRFKVFSHLREWFEEKAMLHREDGKIVAKNDDIESATRYAVMMLRAAISEDEFGQPRQMSIPDYDPFEQFSAAGR